MAGTIDPVLVIRHGMMNVSMESGLDGRNNNPRWFNGFPWEDVSMESGLDGRNNGRQPCSLRLGDS